MAACEGEQLCSAMIVLWAFFFPSVGLKLNINVGETHSDHEEEKLLRSLLKSESLVLGSTAHSGRFCLSHF